MFEYGLLGEDKRFPSVPIILSSDYAFKTERRAKFYTTDEIVGYSNITDKCKMPTFIMCCEESDSTLKNSICTRQSATTASH